VVLNYADLFDQNGAKITFETADTVDAIIAADGRHNFLVELQDRGHSVGVHADIGGRSGWTQSEFEDTLTEMRQKQLDLGINARHVSGICSYVDWVSAAINTGFEGTTSGVAFCYQSMEPEDIPEEYRDCDNPAACHQFVPEELIGRIHPWRAADGSNWIEHDPDGELVLVPSSGTLNCFEENRINDASNTGCGFTPTDIAMFTDEIDLALELVRPDRVNTFYVVWSLGGQLDIGLLETWLQEVNEYVESGQIAWKTIPEMIDLYNSEAE